MSEDREFDPVTGEQIENDAWSKVNGEWVHGHEMVSECWCNPILEYVDAKTGAAVYLHRHTYELH